MLEEIFSYSAEDTKEIGNRIAKELSANSIISFLGELGAGKTTLIKGIISKISDVKDVDITSPTFNYLNVYKGKFEIYHFDLFRIKDEKQFIEMGLSEYLYKNGICLIEWAERINSILPKKILVVHLFNTEEENKRKINIFKI
ncbi:MAG: hypothetical protein AMS24_01630 [Chlamydiae bacterium SM23_39]|nr:MAG: hypothetical protein AMS24_01630 [Chlamydiae bacterium SM23_39]